MMSSRPSSAALLPHRSKKAKHPIAANEKSRYCVDNQAHKPSSAFDLCTATSLIEEGETSPRCE
eukprot:scaffold14696_cov69-Skeletonema_marinoi.AAC.1